MTCCPSDRGHGRACQARSTAFVSPGTDTKGEGRSVVSSSSCLHHTHTSHTHTHNNQTHTGTHTHTHTHNHTITQTHTITHNHTQSHNHTTHTITRTKRQSRTSTARAVRRRAFATTADRDEMRSLVLSERSDWNDRTDDTSETRRSPVLRIASAAQNNARYPVGQQSPKRGIREFFSSLYRACKASQIPRAVTATRRHTPPFLTSP